MDQVFSLPVSKWTVATATPERSLRIFTTSLYSLLYWAYNIFWALLITKLFFQGESIPPNNPNVVMLKTAVNSGHLPLSTEHRWGKNLSSIFLSTERAEIIPKIESSTALVANGVMAISTSWVYRCIMLWPVIILANQLLYFKGCFLRQSAMNLIQVILNY